MKDSQAKAKYTADVGGLVAEARCTIKVPAIMACVPTTKTNITPMPSGAGGAGSPNSFLCYKVKCPKTALPTLAGADQFGTRTVTPKGAQLLCAPLAGPSTTTTTTSSTTSTTMMGCALPATGQTTCWDSSGAIIPCTGTGHDGDTQTGAPLAYVDNGDGTVTDANTGLVWEKQSSDGSVHDMSNTYTWDEAFSGHVATLNTITFAGRTDWRVPNVRELESIVNYGVGFTPAVSPTVNTRCTAGCTVLSCSCTASSFYWSSTTYATFGLTDAWKVNFGSGGVLASAKGTGGHVRGVRGGLSVPHCTTEAGAPCGRCANGICVYRCPTAALVCTVNGFAGPSCSSDADCQPGELCAGGSTDCRSGPTGCAVPCP